MGAHYTDEQIRQMREDYAAGARQRELMDRYGISKAHVHSIVTGKLRRAAGGPISTGGKAGRHLGRGRDITPEEAVEMRHLRADGATQRELAAKYSIACATVRRVCTGEIQPDAGGPLRRAMSRSEARRGAARSRWGISPGDIDSVTGCPFSVCRRERWRYVQPLQVERWVPPEER